MTSRVDVSGLTLKEKGELLHQLSQEIVTVILSQECKARSDNNDRIAGLIRVFKDHYEGYAEDMRDYAAEVD